MSCWLEDPSLFVEYYNKEIKLWRLNKNYNSPLLAHDYHYVCTLPNYLDLVGYSFSWNKSDFESFTAFLYKYDVIVNCQGLVLPINYPREIGKGNLPGGRAIRYMSLEVVNMARYNLPVLSVPYRAVRYMLSGGSAPVESSPKLERQLNYQTLELITELEAANSRLNSDLQREKNFKNPYHELIVSELKAANSKLTDDLQREKNDKNQALELFVSELEAAKSILSGDLQREKIEEKYIVDDRDTSAAEKQDMLNKISRLEADKASLKENEKNLTEDVKIWINEVSALQEKLNRENKDKLALEKKLIDLTSKLEEFCGGGASGILAGDEPWMSGSIMHSDWVSFEDLDAQQFSTSTPLTISKKSSAPAFDQDYTTNIRPSYFYRGLLNNRLVYPIVLVNVDELTPNKEKARFDSNVWGLFINAGTSYASRKPTAAEM